MNCSAQERYPKGLRNRSNYCFANAVFQALSAIPLLPEHIQFLNKATQKLETVTEASTDLLLNLEDVFKHINIKTPSPIEDGNTAVPDKSGNQSTGVLDQNKEASNTVRKDPPSKRPEKHPKYVYCIPDYVFVFLSFNPNEASDCRDFLVAVLNGIASISAFLPDDKSTHGDVSLETIRNGIQNKAVGKDNEHDAVKGANIAEVDTEDIVFPNDRAIQMYLSRSDPNKLKSKLLRVFCFTSEDKSDSFNEEQHQPNGLDYKNKSVQQKRKKRKMSLLSCFKVRGSSTSTEEPSEFSHEEKQDDNKQVHKNSWSTSNIAYQQKNFLSSCFQGTFTSHYVCAECLSEAKFDGNFITLSIHCQYNQTLESSLSTLAQESHMTGKDALFCASCHKLSPAILFSKYTSVPWVLVLHPQVIKATGKLEAESSVLQFPSTVTLSRFAPLVFRDCKNADCAYHLMSFICFKTVKLSAESAESGHFFSFLRYRTDGQWYCLDDEVCMKVSEDQIREFLGGRVTATVPYLLFYVHEVLLGLSKLEKQFF